MLSPKRPSYLHLIAALARTTLVGTAFVPTALGSSGLGGGSLMLAGTAAVLLTACADESQPEYWIEKLDDRAWRPKAIERLNQFYEDALTNADKDPTKPEVQELMNKVVEPLTNIYVNEYQSLDEKARESLINLLASFRDPRTEPALRKALDEFGERGRGGKDVKWASRAVRDMKLKSAAPSVFAAFKKTKPSTKEGAYYRDLNEALLAIADPSWSSELIAMVEEPFPPRDPKKKPTPDQISELKDRTYQTITAAQILGELKEPGAVKPLIKVILDPLRADAANEALLALTKIGKPSVEAAIKLLKDQDGDLADYHKKQIQKATGAPKPPEGSPHVAKAAIIIGTIGRSEGIKPMIEALSSAKEDAEKVELLNALPMLPHTDEVKSAFFEGFDKLSADTAVGGQNASAALSEGATLFFDSSATSMLVKRGRELKDDKVAKSLVALAATKTMDASQVKLVEGLVKSLPEEKEEGPMKKHLENVKHGFEVASKVVETCKKDTACYLKEAEKSENQSDKNQLAGVKALYMIGQLQGPASANALIEAMPAFEEGSLRYVAAQVIDHHHPKGSTEIADKLQVIVDKDSKSMDREVVANVKPLKDALYRLQARAQ